MMKKLMVLVGLTAVLFCGCGKEETEVKTETVDVVEEAIDSMNELNDTLFDYYVAEVCIKAAKEIYGDSFDATKVIENDEGCIYEGKFVSWEEFEEVAYSIMANEM